MGSRLLIAGIFIPIVFWILLRGEIVFLLGVCAVIGISLYEFYSMIKHKDVRVFMKTGILIGISIPIIYYLAYTSKFPKYEKLMVFGIVGIIIFLMTKEILMGEIKEAIRDISYTLFGILYISLLFTHALFMKHVSTSNIDFFGLQVEEGRMWVLTAFLLVWASDSIAYFVGIAIGKNKILPKISPKKSVEGSIAGFLGPIIAMIGIKFWYFPHISILHCIAIGAIVGIFGQLGDFGESLLKREFEIKDSGKIFLGHGGMWDRFDSMLFVMPLLYYYVKIVIY